jgi:hypothetical protein
LLVNEFKPQYHKKKKSERARNVLQDIDGLNNK